MKRLKSQRLIANCGVVSALLVFVLSLKNISAQDSQPVKKVTFSKDVATIIHKKCAGCHQPGQAGPFSLLTYKDVARRAKTIEAVIDSGYMPPWKPVNENVKFVNDRRLSSTEKLVIRNWVKAGMPHGTGQSPAPPKFSGGWSLGKPDLVVQMNGEFEVPASGGDIYRSFVFPVRLNEDKWVKAIEYRPTATTSVHHALFFADSNGNARRMDGQDGKAGIAGMSFLIGSQQESLDSKPNQTWSETIAEIFDRAQKARSGNIEAPVSKALVGGLGGFVPGTIPSRLPGDLAMKLPANSDIVMQTHFHPSGKVEREKGKMAIYFAEKEPSKKLVQIQVPAVFGVGVGLKVPAGESDYTIRESYKTPTDIRLISIGAHAHYICQKVTMTASMPDGKKKTLLKIDDWDLDWQDRYYFEESIVLPAGTVLTTELTYDNSADNPENPNSPPQEIRWGRQSGDEMGSATLQVVAVDESQRPILERSLRKYTFRSVMQGDFVDLLMQLDTNRDGGLQAEEAPPQMQKRFKVLDRNRDGRLVPDELDVIRRLFPKQERLAK